ncbi:type II toxin-antitoxin system Phd/YefM family antitoxin [Saccharophagus sp. K07]|jgi:antitoxin (DNA-binding transcriptional repressor) of toxin-antitoxin stability system|uniref:type II toxin-antitoxin system Phd/YefM family antitoxin n=1 Tax=Saccharophagus sp. K07 TaxID=2283636 RepID=UPI001651DF37|nr:type II toxin-antitoxin system Phd/YefM family antitoxin [Saccharophagus sp. K07]MBC6907367.1 type II toxin-antitoxin system Phd/YefM family antitoxin [Saccharophagus sp. K07]
METLTIRELRNHPGAAQEELARAGELLLTNNGRPVALMLAVDSTNLEETMEVVRRAKGQLALKKLRRQAANQGLDQLDLEAINQQIDATREERRK